MPRLRAAPTAAVLALALAAGAVPAQEPHQHQAGHGPAEPLSAEALAALEAVRLGTERFRDIREAAVAGFRLQDSDWAIMGEHWVAENPALLGFTPERPAALQYVNVAGERVLVGVAYILVQRESDPPPEGFPGSADVWHYHTPAELIPLGFVDARSARQMEAMAGAGGGGVRISMLHAWVWLDNPDGVFAPVHRGLPYLRAGLPPTMAASANVEAALGVDLASGAACDRELEVVRDAAGAGADRVEALGRACRAAEAEAQALVAGAAAADALNGAAAELWRRYDARRRQLLTSEQLERLDILEGHLGGDAPTLGRPPGS